MYVLNVDLSMCIASGWNERNIEIMEAMETRLRTCSAFIDARSEL